MSTDLIGMILPFGIMIGMMYFLLIRPQKQQQQKVQSMLDGLEVNDSVVTVGGLHGVIEEIDTEDGIVVLDCEGIYLTFERRSIARVVSKGTEVGSMTGDLGVDDSTLNDTEE